MLPGIGVEEDCEEVPPGQARRTAESESEAAPLGRKRRRKSWKWRQRRRRKRLRCCCRRRRPHSRRRGRGHGGGGVGGGFQEGVKMKKRDGEEYHFKKYRSFFFHFPFFLSLKKKVLSLLLAFLLLRGGGPEPGFAQRVDHTAQDRASHCSLFLLGAFAAFAARKTRRRNLHRRLFF